MYKPKYFLSKFIENCSLNIQILELHCSFKICIQRITCALLSDAMLNKEMIWTLWECLDKLWTLLKPRSLKSLLKSWKKIFISHESLTLRTNFSTGILRAFTRKQSHITNAHLRLMSISRFPGTRFPILLIDTECIVVVTRCPPYRRPVVGRGGGAE